MFVVCTITDKSLFTGARMSSEYHMSNVRTDRILFAFAYTILNGANDTPTKCNICTDKTVKVQQLTT